MDVEKIRELRLAYPFKPFYLIMRDGRSLPVEREFYLGIGPKGKNLVYAAPKGGFDILKVDDVLDTKVDEKMQTPWRRAD